MNNNLLILCDSTYGITVKEIAESMKCFGKIDFLSSDYGKTESAEKRHVESVGSLDSYESFASTYGYAIAVFEESDKRLEWTQKLVDACFAIASIISPMAYLSPSSQIHQGSVIEPFVAIGSNTVIETCCILEANTIVNRECYIGNGSRLKNNCVVKVGGYVADCREIEINRVIENYEESVRIAKEYN